MKIVAVWKKLVILFTLTIVFLFAGNAIVQKRSPFTAFIRVR